MKTNPEGIALIRTFESLRLTAYFDSGGVLTVGWGHTGKDVHWGMKITEAEAEVLFEHDVSLFEFGVSRWIKVPVTSNQFSALVSLAYNIGIGNFCTSTLLHLLNSGKECSDQFLVWDKSGGKFSPGLLRRREAEKALFLKQ